MTEVKSLARLKIGSGIEFLKLYYNWPIGYIDRGRQENVEKSIYPGTFSYRVIDTAMRKNRISVYPEDIGSGGAKRRCFLSFF